jgi:hypothetical protein
MNRCTSTCGATTWRRRFGWGPIEVAFNHGFAGHEISDIEDIILENHSQLTKAWYEHCGR